MGFFSRLLPCVPSSSSRSAGTAKPGQQRSPATAEPSDRPAPSPPQEPALSLPPEDSFKHDPLPDFSLPIRSPSPPSSTAPPTDDGPPVISDEPMELTETADEPPVLSASPASSLSDLEPTPTSSAPAADRSSLSRLAPPSKPSHAFSLSPPTPVDPPDLPFTERPPSPTASSTPPRTASPLPVSPPPPSPGTLSPPVPASPRWAAHHRRNSSASSRRSFKETLNAFTNNDGKEGRTVNQYVFKERLGSGSYATVERATDRVTGIDYAVKEFSKTKLRRRQTSEAMKGGRGPRGPKGRPPPLTELSEQNQDEQGPINLALVQKEVAIMKKLDHPNIAVVYEVIDVTSDDALLIVMELCAGGPVAHVSLEKESPPMDEDVARNIFAQMVMGIAYLHHNRVVHRDIKPDNALLLADGETVKIVDFGISEMIEPNANDLIQKSIGSPAFMAPELVSKAHPHLHGYACDVWALGATLFAMVAGRLPFARDNLVDLMDAIRDDDIVYPTALSPELLHLLHRMLEKDAHKRVTLHDLWDDPWITNKETAPLVPYDENCREPMDEPTETEQEAALKAQQNFNTSVAVLLATKKFRRGTMGRSSGSEGGASGSLEESMASLGLTPGRVESPETFRLPLPAVDPPQRKDTSSSFQSVAGSEATSVSQSGSTPGTSEGHSKGELS